MAGRPAKYKTKKALQRAVERYFDSICCTTTAHYDNGDVIVSDAGDPVKVKNYIVPPSISGLCISLGIHRNTWANYCDEAEHPEFADVTRMARLEIENYLETQLMTKEKNISGVIFQLQNNFGWKDKREVELGEKTRQTVKTENMSLSEKLELIARASAGMAADGIEAPSGCDNDDGE